MISVYELRKQYPDVWEEADEDSQAFLSLLASRDIITWEDFDEWKDFVAAEWKKEIVIPGDPEETRARIAAALFEAQKPWYKLSWQEILKNFWDQVRASFDIFGDAARVVADSILDWLKENIWEFMKWYWNITKPVRDWLREHVPEFLDWIWGHVKAMFEQYWPPLEAKIEAAGEHIFDWTTKFLLGQGEVTPEKAPGMASKMLTLALTAGITAHAMSVGFEMIHPFKSLGFHQMTGMVAQLGSFGPVSAATLGQIHYAALRLPMSYAVNKVTRSKIPDESMLQLMAVKPDILDPEFTENMRYMGYSEHWINKIRKTMYHEPRYFELKMMSEDMAATDEWLALKVHRAGYNDADTEIFVKSLRAAAIKMQRLDYYKQGANLFKEGYIPREYLERILEDIELLPKGRKFAIRAVELAYLADTIKDEAKYWTDSYLKDLVTEDELTLQLALLGLNPMRRDLAVRLARVRKYKKPGRPVKTELEKVTNKVRSKYSQAYITLYRRELIDLDTLLADLVAIGILPELAEATCTLEAARKATPAEV